MTGKVELSTAERERLKAEIKAELQTDLLAGMRPELLQLIQDPEVRKALGPAAEQWKGALENAGAVVNAITGWLRAVVEIPKRAQRALLGSVSALPAERLLEYPVEPAFVDALRGAGRHPEGSPLHEMFRQLLERSIDRQRSGEAHPAFGKIVDQLSPDEALILWHLSHGEFTVEMYYSIPERKFVLVKDRELSSDFPLDCLASPKHEHMYYTHLENLSLLRRDNLDTSQSDDVAIPILVRQRIRLSAFGRLFADACIPEQGFSLMTR